MPEIVLKCRASWRHYCPDYTIELLDPGTAAKYLPDHVTLDSVDSRARYTDYLRLAVLSEHGGGIWMDASILLTEDLRWIDERCAVREDIEVVAFYQDVFTTVPKWPVVEAWFIAAVPGSEVMMRWRDEFFSLLTFESPWDYIRDLESKGVDLQALTMQDYLAVDAALQCVMQLGPGYIADRIVALRAEDGPYKLLADAGGDVDRAPHVIIDGVCSRDVEKPRPFIKLRYDDRRLLADEMGNCPYLNDLK
jgi:hypothetical protein